MALFIVATTIYLSIMGYSFYSLPLEERFYHPQYDWFKPSGLFGQGLGVVGTFLIVFGVTIYILRKRYGVLERYIRLKYLLEFHIFLCTLGPILVLFHTSFKFGGIVSIAFWSMVAVVLSGVIGRFIYIQIPRSIEGRELSLEEVEQKGAELSEKIEGYVGNDFNYLKELMNDNSVEKWNWKTPIKNRNKINRVKSELKDSSLTVEEKRELLLAVKEKLSLSSRIGRLNQMKQLFKYWHVAHMPFALIMLVIVVIHVGVAIAFGYKWIF